MLTSTTPALANACPSYSGIAELPLAKAPPWIQTMTGRAAASGSGVQTFRFSQSSPAILGSAKSVSNGDGESGLGGVGPYATASLTPVHGSAGTGALNRLLPVGLAA